LTLGLALDREPPKVCRLCSHMRAAATAFIRGHTMSTESRHRLRRPVDTAGQRFLRIKQLVVRWSVHRSTIWRWVKKGELAKPRRLGPNVVAWPLSVIEAFEERWA
jgi:predicted DNA-binding transcriptional regulator AlpA